MDKSKKPADKTLTHKVGDRLERLGEKLKDKGYTKTGNAVYKTGNKIEHSRDNKK